MRLAVGILCFSIGTVFYMFINMNPSENLRKKYTPSREPQFLSWNSAVIGSLGQLPEDWNINVTIRSMAQTLTIGATVCAPAVIGTGKWRINLAYQGETFPIRSVSLSNADRRLPTNNFFAFESFNIYFVHDNQWFHVDTCNILDKYKIICGTEFVNPCQDYVNVKNAPEKKPKLMFSSWASGLDPLLLCNWLPAVDSPCRWLEETLHSTTSKKLTTPMKSCSSTALSETIDLQVTMKLPASRCSKY